MSRTTSPWATPTSPAGRRLLLTEPATLDAVAPLRTVMSEPVMSELAVSELAVVGLDPRPSVTVAPATPAPLPVLPTLPIDREELATSRPWSTSRPRQARPGRSGASAFVAGSSVPGTAVADPDGAGSSRACVLRRPHGPAASGRGARRLRLGPDARRRAPSHAVAVVALVVGLAAVGPIGGPEGVAEVDVRPAVALGAVMGAAPAPAAGAIASPEPGLALRVDGSDAARAVGRALGGAAMMTVG